MKHIFAICAYKDSPYLSECLKSLQEQTSPSQIILCTATPSPALEAVARDNGLEYFVNSNPPDIAGDWNFAQAQAKALGADCMTLCHQDDLYLPEYGEHFKKAMEAHPDLLIWFADYSELRGGTREHDSRNLRIKRTLLWRLRLFPGLGHTRWAKRRSIAYGDAICCPSVSFNLNRIRLPLFKSGMSSDLDWQAWERLSRQEGRFVYDPDVLMLHRIHEGSATTGILGDGERRWQDLSMFRLFWPKPIAALLARLYSGSEKSNSL